MKRATIFSKGARLWKAGVLAFAVVLVTVFSFYSNEVSAQFDQTTPPSTVFYAPMTGERIGNVNPQGFGRYVVYSNGTRVFETVVDHINLPVGTDLTVSLGGNSVGQITLSPMRNGRLLLSTGRGETVPVVTSGDTLTVKNGKTVILSGAFSAPPPPPPAPSSALYARLTGATVDGVMPHGVSHYAEYTSSRKLGFFASPYQSACRNPIECIDKRHDGRTDHAPRNT